MSYCNQILPNFDYCMKHDYHVLTKINVTAPFCKTFK